MDYLHYALLKNNFPELMMQEPEKNPLFPTKIQKLALKFKKKVLMSFPYVPSISAEFRNIFYYMSDQLIIISNHTNAP